MDCEITLDLQSCLALEVSVWTSLPFFCHSVAHLEASLHVGLRHRQRQGTHLQGSQASTHACLTICMHAGVCSASPHNPGTAHSPQKPHIHAALSGAQPPMPRLAGLDCVDSETLAKANPNA